VPPGFSPPAKITSSLQAKAAEFVPPGFETKGVKPTIREISEKAKVPSLQANAAEFVPPGFETSKKEEKEPSLQANAAEFVPPEFAKQKAVEPTCTEEEKRPTFDPPQNESSSETCWAHAVLTPAASLESAKQPSTQPVEVPALMLNTCEPSGVEESAKWSARINTTSILGKVKQSLTTFSLGYLGPKGASKGEDTKDPCIGKVQEKVKKIEEKEADNEAEKAREAAIKAVNEKVDAQKKQFQEEMDETLLDCFLQAVTTRVKDRDLPIMGTSLYGKMRLCRCFGTSCDVKDSSYVWMRSFLEHLEECEMLKLKPEVKDPTVTWINRKHKMIRDFEPWPYSQTVGSRKEGGRR